MKQQRIQWNTVIRKPEKGERQKRRVLTWENAAFSVFLALIFQLATLLLLNSLFEEKRMLFRCMGGFLITNLLVSVGVLAGKLLYGKKEALVKLAVWLLEFGGLAFLLFKDAFWKEVLSGLGGFLTEYIRDWNSYYGMAIPTPGGNLADAPEAVFLLLLVLYFWMLWNVENYSAPGLLAVVPVTVFILQLLIGESTEGMALFLLFAGIVLANSRGFRWTDFRSFLQNDDNGAFIKQRMAWIVTMGSLLLFFGAVVGLTGKSAKRQVSEYAKDAEDIVEETVEQVVNWKVWTEVEGPEELAKLLEKAAQSLLEGKEVDRAVIDNEKPEFNNTPYLLVTMEEQPTDRLYLKGFSAGNYREGIWENEESDFKRACFMAGYNAEELAESLANLAMMKLKWLYQVEKLRNTGIPTEIFYYHPKTDMAYVPYFSDTMESGLFTVREGDLEKATRTESFEVVLWQNSGNYTEHLSLLTSVGKEEWEEWYEDYVESRYLEVPEELTEVKALAAELAERPYTGEEIKTTRINQERLAYAAIVADWFARNTTYSQVLPELPKGTDPIAYFLGTSKKGYCMHYASAGTMLLRALGVPARYASGYVVGASSFSDFHRENPQAIVLDNQAHAWVEIYLEGIGWVPVEVTGGYASRLPLPSLTPKPTEAAEPTTTPTVAPTEAATLTEALTPEPSPVLTPKETAAPTEAEAPTNVPNGTPSPKPTEEAAQLPQEALTPKPTGTFQTDSVTPKPEQSGKPTSAPNVPENGEEPQAPLGDTETARDEKFWNIVKIGILAVLTPMIFLLFFFGIKRLCHWMHPMNRFTRRLIREVRRYGAAAGICLIHQKAYRKLLRLGKVKTGVSDKLLEDTIRNLYMETKPENWDTYFRLVMEANYSNTELTEEDVLFCFRLYRDVISKRLPRAEIRP